VVFFGSFRGSHEAEHHIHEGPASMNIPLVVLAVLSVVGGALNLPGGHWMGHFFAHNVSGMNVETAPAPDHNTTLMLMIAAGAMSVIILIITYIIYGRKHSVPVADDQISGWAKLSANKLYFDEIYHFLFVRPVEWMAEKGAHYFEGLFLHRSVVGIGQLIGRSGQLVRKWQTGRTDSYILWMVFGIIGLVAYFLINKN
jgi:NADH-quinone oxidoreductase subunit L